MHTRLRADVRTEDQIDGEVNQDEADIARALFDGHGDETEHMLRAIVAAVIQ